MVLSTLQQKQTIKRYNFKVVFCSSAFRDHQARVKTRTLQASVKSDRERAAKIIQRNFRNWQVKCHYRQLHQVKMITIAQEKKVVFVVFFSYLSAMHSTVVCMLFLCTTSSTSDFSWNKCKSVSPESLGTMPPTLYSTKLHGILYMPCQRELAQT